MSSTGTQRAGRTIVKLSILVSLFTGCSEKIPTAPGTSVPLRYPVLLAGERRLVVKDDELSLTTSTGATGLNFPEFTLFDSDGARYTIRKVTEFGRKSAVLDMGTSHFRVFLDLKSTGKPNLARAKSLLKEVAFSTGHIQDTQTASQAIDSADSFPALIELSRRAWEWR